MLLDREPDSAQSGQHASRTSRAGAADRDRDRLGAHRASRSWPAKRLPFDIKDWPHIVLNGLEILNRNNWFPVCTLDRRIARRDGRGLDGDARPALRGRAPRPPLHVGAVHLHAAREHAHGARRGRPRDAAPVEAPVAGDHEGLGDRLPHRTCRRRGARCRSGSDRWFSGRRDCGASTAATSRGR